MTEKGTFVRSLLIISCAPGFWTPNKEGTGRWEWGHLFFNGTPKKNERDSQKVGVGGERNETFLSTQDGWSRYEKTAMEKVRDGGKKKGTNSTNPDVANKGGGTSRMVGKERKYKGGTCSTILNKLRHGLRGGNRAETEERLENSRRDS